MGHFTKTTSPFYSQNTRCIGDLYLPGDVKTPPVVVMAHGFAAERSFGLPNYRQKFAAYRPTVHAKNVKCPALLMAGEYDSLINIKAVEKTANKMPDGKLIKYPLGHFDLYKGDAFADAVQKQTDFLLTHLVH